jgi:hypothetical protein
MTTAQANSGRTWITGPMAASIRGTDCHVRPNESKVSPTRVAVPA